MTWDQSFWSVGSNLAQGTGTAPQLWLFSTGGAWTTADCFKNATKLSNYTDIPKAWGGK
ncbi:MAG TPA: hypothetical protein PK979_02390 [Bacteroidales bacterium]|nr:hypothetical protein [Bacteroidales bacterium]HPK29873.1 hypothetical protein [Bacteroidales bacterium]